MSEQQAETIFELTAEDVKNIRAKTEMTQKDFSKVFGINLSTLRHWERGDRAPHGSAVILLKMINNSPREVYSILENRMEKDMTKSANKEILKSLILTGKYKTLSDLINSERGKIKEIISALIAANGFPYQELDIRDNKNVFLAGHALENLHPVLECCEIDEPYIEGELKKVIENTYRLVFSIEHELSDAMYLPHEMRQKRIESVITNLGIDTDFYSNVLKNW